MNETPIQNWVSVLPGVQLQQGSKTKKRRKEKRSGNENVETGLVNHRGRKREKERA